MVSKPAKDLLRRQRTRYGQFWLTPMRRLANGRAPKPFFRSLVQWLDRPALSLVAAERALAMLAEIEPSELPFILGLSDFHSLVMLATISGGRALFLEGDIDQARVWLERGLQAPEAAYSIWLVNGLGSLALLEAWCGNLDRAEVVVNEALDVGPRHRATVAPFNS